MNHSPKSYLFRSIFSAVFLTLGIVFLWLFFQNNPQYQTGERPAPPSIHQMTKEEAQNQYVSISSLRVTRVVQDSLYVEVPLADHTVMELEFCADPMLKQKIQFLQMKKDTELSLQSNNSAADNSLHFISVNYSGLCQRFEFHEGALPPNAAAKYLPFGIVLVGFGICALIFSLVNLLRKPKIIPVSDMQSVYSAHELKTILKQKPIYETIWLSESTVLFMKNQHLTQVNFRDITTIALSKVKINHILSYMLEITDRFDHCQVLKSESKDVIFAFAQYFANTNPNMSISPSLSAEFPTLVSGKKDDGQHLIPDIQHRRFTEEFLYTLNIAKHQHRKEILHFFSCIGILIIALTLMSGVGLFLPQFMRSFILGSQPDAMQILNSMIYPVVVPVITLGILWVLLVMGAVHCVKRSGSYFAAAALISLLLGGISILIGFSSALQDIGFSEVMQAIEDKRQIQSGDWSETTATLVDIDRIDAKELLKLEKDTGSQILRISAIPADTGIQSEPAFYYAFSSSDILAYKSTEENPSTCVQSIQIHHTENLHIVIAAEAFKE